MLNRTLLAFCTFFAVLQANGQQNNATAFYQSGVALSRENKIVESFEAFTKALILNNKFDSCYLEIGNLYLKTGNEDYAIVNFRQALQLNPVYTEAWMNLGRIYRDSRHIYDSAIYYYNAAAAVDTNNKEIFYALAWTYNAKKEFDSALTFAVKALNVDNNYKPAYGELGFACRSMKKYTECIDILKQRLTVSVVDLALLYTGYCYAEINNKEKALETYEWLNKVNDKMAVSLKKKIDSMQ
jgi:tetratricopeptide (TPR) repeat protein